MAFNSLIQGLINPKFDLSGVGQQAGGLMGGLYKAQYDEAQREKLKQQQVANAMSAAGMMGVNPGGADPLSAMAAMTAGIKNMTPEDVTRLQQSYTFGRQVQNMDAQKKAQQIKTLEEAGKESTLNARRSRAIQVALENKDPQAAKILRSAPAETVEAYLTKEIGGLTDAKSTGVVVRDSEGNHFQQINKKDGGVDLVPFTPDQPNKPVGGYEVVDKSFGRSSFEDINAALSKSIGAQQSEQYNKIFEKAVETYDESQKSLGIFRRMNEASSQMGDSGSKIRAVVNEYKKITGDNSTNMADLEANAGMWVAQNVKAMFGGQLSNQEAARVEALTPRPEDSAGARMVKLQALFAMAEEKARIAKEVINAGSWEGYQNMQRARVNQGGTSSTSGAPVSFSDLPR